MYCHTYLRFHRVDCSHVTSSMFSLGWTCHRGHRPLTFLWWGWTDSAWSHRFPVNLKGNALIPQANRLGPCQPLVYKKRDKIHLSDIDFSFLEDVVPFFSSEFRYLILMLLTGIILLLNFFIIIYLFITWQPFFMIYLCILYNTNWLNLELYWLYYFDTMQVTCFIIY